MASRDVRVKITGDPADLERAFKRAGQSTKQLEHQTKSLQEPIKKVHDGFKQLAFGMLGAGGVVFGLEQMVEAAKKAQESIGHLDITMKDAGLSYEKNKEQIEGVISAQSQLSAFQKSDLRETYGALIRQTKDVGEANKDLALAVDIARGRHIELAAAQNIVIKANIGMTGALRRMGIDIKPVHDAVNALTDSHLKFTTAQKDAAKALDAAATKQAAIALLQKTYAGSAEEYGKSSAGAAERFKVSLTNLEVTLGTALLPTLTQGLTHVTDWVNKLNDSGDAAKYAKKTVDTLKEIIHDSTPVVKGSAKAFQTLADALGGTKQAVEVLGGTLAAWKLTSVLGGLGGAAGEKGAAGKVGLLTSRLKALGALGVIAVALEIDLKLRKSGTVGKILSDLGTPAQGLTDIANYVVGQVGGDKSAKPVSIPISSSQADTNAKAKSGAARSGHGAVSWSGDYSGLDSGFKSKVEQCVAAAGGTSINVTSGRRSPDHNATVGGAQNSNHLTGRAADGTCVINGHSYPLGQAPMAYSRYGLRAGATFNWGGGPDIYHVDDGSNVGGVPTAPPQTAADIVSQGTSPTHKAKKPTVLSGDALLSHGLQVSLARDVGTKSTADNVRDLKKAREELMQMPQTLNVVKELASVNKRILQIQTADTKKAHSAQEAAMKRHAAEEIAQLKQMDVAWKKHVAVLQAAADEAKRIADRSFQEAASALMGALDAQRAQLTPTEQKIKDLQDARAAKGRADAISQAQSDLDAAIAAGDPAAIAAAQATLDAAQFDQQLSDLQVQADKERKARDDEYASKSQALQDWLDDQKAKLDSGAEKWSQFYDDLKQKASDSGFDIGAAFWDAWNAAADANARATAAQSNVNAQPESLAGIAPPGSTVGGSSYGSGSYVVGGILITPPKMARGGIVNGPTLAMVGEAGPEAIIPLSGNGAALSADVPLVINLDGERLFAGIQRIALKNKRRNGDSGLT